MNIFTEKCWDGASVYCVVAVAVVSGGNHYILDRKRFEDGTSNNRDDYLNCDDENDLKISVKDSKFKEKGIRTVRKNCQEKILLKILKIHFKYQLLVESLLAAPVDVI